MCVYRWYNICTYIHTHQVTTETGYDFDFFFYHYFSRTNQSLCTVFYVCVNAEMYHYELLWIKDILLIILSK